MTAHLLTNLLLAIVTIALMPAVTPALSAQQLKPPATDLLEEFKSTRVFWRQLEVAKKIVALRDHRILTELESWLTIEDRHLRGNAAFIFAGLGDDRGWEILGAILGDMSNRAEGQGIPMAPSNGQFSLAAQISADRYYAVHLLGKLKDERAVPILVPLLTDSQVHYKVAWALGEIGGEAAVDLLIGALDDESADVRVIAIHSLEKLGARKALPRLRALLGDEQKSHFGAQESVREAARAAITTLQAL